MNVLFLLSLVGYLFGCLHGSQLVGKLKRINFKRIGTKNAGASNATLILGWRYGVLVAVIDIGKALLSLQVAMYILHYFQVPIDSHLIYLLINGLFVVLGHNFPITMNFNGGKGTASFLGVLLFLNWKVALFSVIIALVLAFVTNYFVLGTLSGYVSFTLYTFYTQEKGPIMLSVIFTLLFLWQHRENFNRIMKKEEMKLRSFFRREAS